MAYIMTFDTLQDDLRRYLERGFTEDSDPIVYDQIPRLINMAERRLARELKIQGFQRVLTQPVAEGVAVYTKPDRWRDTVSMRIGQQPVFSRSYEYIRSFWPDESETATPKYYADYDYSHWIVAPTPEDVEEMEVIFYELPALLDDSKQTNWLTEFAPNALLYGALLEASPFLKDDQRVQLWQSMYDRAAQTLNGEDLQKILDRNSARSSA